MKTTQKIIAVSLFIFLLFGLAACSFTGKNTSHQKFGIDPKKGKIIVGGKDFTEQYLLTKITSIYLKENGYQIEEVDGMKSKVARSALEHGHIDLYWEYTGTALTVYMHQPAETDPGKAYQWVKKRDQANGLIWLDRTKVNNTYTILMRKDEAQKLGIQTLSDLANFVNQHPGQLKFATDAEFLSRDDGLKGLEATYGFHFPGKNVIRMNSGLLYSALKEKQVDVSVGFATDGRIKAYQLVPLKDNKSYFPAYNAAPVVREKVLKKYKKLAQLLNNIADRLNMKTMRHLNYEVDLKHKSVTKVARDWLRSEKLVQP